MINQYTKFWHKLNINIENALHPDFLNFIQNEKQLGAKYYNFSNQNDILNNDWQQYIYNDYGIKFSSALVFMRDKGITDNFAHQDHIVCAAINWCIGLDDRPMHWWNSNQLAEKKVHPVTGDYYYAWPLDILGAPIDQHLIGNQPTLVRVDVPHQISEGSESRICISLRLINDPSWEDAVNQCFNMLQV